MGQPTINRSFAMPPDATASASVHTPTPHRQAAAHTAGTGALNSMTHPTAPQVLLTMPEPKNVKPLTRFPFKVYVLLEWLRLIRLAQKDSLVLYELKRFISDGVLQALASFYRVKSFTDGNGRLDRAAIMQSQRQLDPTGLEDILNMSNDELWDLIQQTTAVQSNQAFWDEIEQVLWPKSQYDDYEISFKRYDEFHRLLQIFCDKYLKTCEMLLQYADPSLWPRGFFTQHQSVGIIEPFLKAIPHDIGRRMNNALDQKMINEIVKPQRRPGDPDNNLLAKLEHYLAELILYSYGILKKSMEVKDISAIIQTPSERALGKRSHTPRLSTLCAVEEECEEDEPLDETANDLYEVSATEQRRGCISFALHGACKRGSACTFGHDRASAIEVAKAQHELATKALVRLQRGYPDGHQGHKTIMSRPNAQVPPNKPAVPNFQRPSSTAGPANWDMGESRQRKPERGNLQALEDSGPLLSDEED